METCTINRNVDKTINLGMDGLKLSQKVEITLPLHMCVSCQNSQKYYN